MIAATYVLRIWSWLHITGSTKHWWFPTLESAASTIRALPQQLQVGHPQVSDQSRVTATDLLLGLPRRPFKYWIPRYAKVCKGCSHLWRPSYSYIYIYIYIYIYSNIETGSFPYPYPFSLAGRPFFLRYVCVRRGSVGNFNAQVSIQGIDNTCGFNST